VIRRSITALILLFLLTVMVFGIIQAPPGDFVDAYIARLMATGDLVTQEEVEALRRSLGLEDSAVAQYVRWVGNLVRGNLGFSFENRRPVIDMVKDRLPLTVLLSLLTILFTWSMAIPIGILSAVKQYSWIDHFFTFLSYLGVGTPNFLFALVLMWVALTMFGWSVGGLYSQEYYDAPWSIGKLFDLLKHIWIPMVVIGTDGTAGLVRVMRANLLDELRKPYVETARARGLPGWKVVLKYPVRLALNPFISTVGWTLPSLMSANLIVAVVLSLPTLDPLLLDALFAQDFLMAGSLLMIVSVLTILGTFISDILLAVVDPRIRVEA
jgi:peptide/nickel transport system permease protein